MRPLFQLAGLVALSVAAVHAPAQISNPSDLVVGPPKPPAAREHARASHSGNLQWLWPYAQPIPNGNPVALRNDERFLVLLDTSFPQPQAFWGKQVPLSAVIPRFLARYGEINAKDNRYLVMDGCVPSFCAAHGMLWIDLGGAAEESVRHSTPPLLVFVAVDWTTEGRPVDDANADYNLWLFTSRPLSADALPFALTTAISDWDARLAQAHRGVPHIAHAILVQPDGTPVSLNPALAGANTLPPQPDTAISKPPDSE